MYIITDMAQRQRAGLITPRSLDRNGLSVLFVICFHFINNVFVTKSPLPIYPLPLYPFTHLPLYPFTPLPIYPFTHLPIYPLPVYPFTPLPLYPFTPLPLYPFTPLCIIGPKN